MPPSAAPLADSDDRSLAFARPETSAPMVRASAQVAADTSLFRAGRPLMWATFSVAALPIFRLADMTRSFDQTLISAAVFIGIAWHLWTFVAPRREPPGVVVVAASLLAAALTWQLCWIPPAEFWFVCVALLASVVCLVVLWSGMRRGWQAIAAMAVWVAWLQGGNRWQEAFFGPWICERTAALAGWILWQGGAEVSVEGARIRLADGAVEVGGPCTGLPLILILLVLLVMTALLLRLRFGTVLRLSAIAMVTGFFVGVVRVALLAEVVNDAARFNYWHSPDGASWFTAASMAILAWFISGAVSTGTWGAPRRIAGSEPVRALRWMAWPIGAAVALAFVVGGRIEDDNFSPENFEPPRWAGATLQGRELKRFEVGPRPYNAFAWQQQATYSLDGGGKLHVTLAYVPLMLEANAVQLPDAPVWVKDTRDWQRGAAPRAGVWMAADHRGRGWVAALTPDRAEIATEITWQAAYREGFFSAERWWAWLTQQRPLCDKRAFFLALRCEPAQDAGGASESVLSAALSAWRSRLREASSHGSLQDR